MAIIWSNAARHDFVRIFDFNASHDPHRAARIDHRLFEVAGKLERRPRIGRMIERRDIGKWSLADLQYVVRYQIDKNDMIVLGFCDTRERRESL